MKKNSCHICFLLLAFIGTAIHSFGQCSNCTSYYPASIQTMPASGSTTIATCIWGGEYSVYNVIAGETYTWSTCSGTWDTQLTLFSGNTCGGVNIAYNDDFCGLQSTITWTATFTGQVTLLLSQYNCTNNTSCMAIDWAVSSSPGADPSCGDNFYDPGGASGNYSNNAYVITTICPDSPGDCVTVTFNSFSLETNWDYLTVHNGIDETAPIVGDYTGTALSGQTIQTANPGDCLTFVFDSDGSITYPGWSATISCGECGELPPASPQDCNGASTICSNQSFSGNSSGAGTQELNFTNAGCLSTENQSSWFFFSPQAVGTIAFMLTPTPSQDYDFAVWGPYDDAVCPPPGPPIRCSWAAPSVPTGLQAGAGDNSEGAAGDGVVNPITVGAADVGKVYIIMIDNWSASSTPFDFSWDLGGGTTLDCTPLPVEMISFEGHKKDTKNELIWSVASESNADYYTIERSRDGTEYETLGNIPATGNSSHILDYSFVDESPAPESYYLLKQTDFNGNSSYYGPVVVGRSRNEAAVSSPYPNPVQGGLTTLDIQLIQDGDITCRITDLTGRTLYLKDYSLHRGHHQLPLDISNFASGSYALQLVDDQQQVLHSSLIIK